MSQTSADPVGAAVEDALQRLMSHPEAAAYLDVSPETLHGWNRKGTGPKSYRVGKHRKYRLRDLDLWLEERASVPSAK